MDSSPFGQTEVCKTIISNHITSLLGLNLCDHYDIYMSINLAICKLIYDIVYNQYTACVFLYTVVRMEKKESQRSRVTLLSSITPMIQYMKDCIPFMTDRKCSLLITSTFWRSDCWIGINPPSWSKSNYTTYWIHSMLVLTDLTIRFDHLLLLDIESVLDDYVQYSSRKYILWSPVIH